MSWLAWMMVWVSLMGGGGVSVALWTPQTPLGWMTCTTLMGAFLSHVVQVLEGAWVRAIVQPGLLAACAVLMHLSFTALPSAFPEVVAQSWFLSWFLGVSSWPS